MGLGLGIGLKFKVIKVDNFFYFGFFYTKRELKSANENSDQIKFFLLSSIEKFFLQLRIDVQFVSQCRLKIANDLN